jgi:hypothetical protein
MGMNTVKFMYDIIYIDMDMDKDMFTYIYVD